MSLRQNLISVRQVGLPPRRLGASLLAGMLLLASAADASDPPARAAYRQLAQSCTADLDRYCSDLPDSRRTGRNAAICLKPYRSSLSLPCRHAVQAIFP